MDRNKLSEYFKNYIDNIKSGFIPDGDLNGLKGFLSRIKNLWGHSLQGKITIIAVCLIGLSGLSDSSSTSSRSSTSSTSSSYENKVRRCQKNTSLGKCNEVLQTNGTVYWCVNEMIHG